MYNPKRDEIKKFLLLGQSSINRHVITKRVYKQKLKSSINFHAKHYAFIVEQVIERILLKGKN